MKTIYIILAFILTINTALSRDGFILNSLDEAKTLSRITERPILLIFGTDTCRYCETLKKDILDGSLSPLIDKYIICYIDIDRSLELKNEYNISSIPDSRIFFKQNMTTQIRKGYNKKEYIKWLKDAQ